MTVDALHLPTFYAPTGEHSSSGATTEQIEKHAASVTEAQAEVVEARPRVRSATPADVSALVNIELRAYSDVYGLQPTEKVVSGLHQKYAERIDFLGEWIRVLESPEYGVCGLMVCCPTNRGKSDFMQEERDLTDNATIRDIYDPTGKNSYIVNLAVLPEMQGKGGHFELFADAIQLGMQAGIEKAYFESRLPGFGRWLDGPWVKHQYGIAERLDVPPPTAEDLAQIYWRLTEPREGIEKPRDPLLRLYTDFGCVPLRLIKDAWKPDGSSQGYGVLCEFTSPQPDPVVENIAEKPGFIRGALAWAKRYKGLLAIGAGAGGLAYETARGGLGEVVDGLREAAPWVIPAYAGSWALLLAGGAAILTGLGRKVSFSNLMHHPVQELVDSAEESRIAKAGFYVNAIGAAAAAGVVGVGLVTALPAAVALPALAVPLVDLFSTLALRWGVYSAYKQKRVNASGQ